MIGRRLLWLAALVSLIWRIGLLPGETSDCGPVGPHGHELLGQADSHSLAEHLAAEAACRAGQSAPQPKAASHANRGLVLSIGTLDDEGAVLVGLALIALLPCLAVLSLPGELWYGLPSAAWARPSLELPPPSPPPYLASCVSSII